MNKQLLTSLLLSLISCVGLADKRHFVLNDIPTSLDANSAINTLGELLDSPEGVTFQKFRDEIDELGIRHQSFQQYYHGTQVESFVVMIHSRGGFIQSINGSRVLIAPHAKGSISKRHALRKANRRSSNDSEIQTVIVDVNGELHYAYKIEANDEMQTYYIDTETGQIIKRIPYFQNANVSGTGYTLYNGWQPMECYENNGLYYLMDEDRNIVTLNANGNVADLENLIANAPDSIQNIREADSISADDANKVLSYAYSAYIESCNQIINDEANWYISALSSVTITAANSSWWYDIWDQKPDIYIKIFNHNGVCVYTSSTKNDVSFPVTFNIANPIVLENAGYTIKIYDEDATTDAYGGSITVSSATRGIYSWSSASTTSGSFVISALPAGYFDVHWGMQKTYDFYLTQLNRNSFDNQGSIIYSLVYPPHSDLFQTMPNNAAARKVIPYFMYYGMGDGINMNPVVSLDVLAHEFTHLVTQNNGNGGLDYEQESGALNESFSDIMAMGVEFYATDTCKWNVGEGIMVQRAAMRSFIDPHLYDQPSYYLYDAYWSTLPPDQDSTQHVVHTNSGVQNKWFYILAHGEDDIEGIGMDNAIRIAYRNLIYYLAPNANYHDAREGSILAATDLFGANSVEVETVKNAWDAVGVYDLTLQPGKYVIYSYTNDDQLWFMSSNLTTTNTKRLVADTNAYIGEYFYSEFIWNVIRNADGTYQLENNGNYVTWLSGNSCIMSATPRDFEISPISEEYNGIYSVSFKASETETRYLSYNTANGLHYFAFYANTNQLYQLYFSEVEEAEARTIWAKMPSDWGNTIRVWVWYDGMDGFWDTPTRTGEWFTYQGLGNYNIIFVNGTTWTGDNNQTIDISVSSDMCIQLETNIAGKRTFSSIDCENHGTSLEGIPQSSRTQKLFQNGKFCILLPDGTKYSASGKKVE